MRTYYILVIILAFFMFAALNCSALSLPENHYHKSHHQQKKEELNLELSGRVENGIRIIEVRASRYKFEPDPIVVKLGERVRLVATGTDVTHGIAIAEFKVNLTIPPRKTSIVEFIADKIGTFHAYCSVYCGSGHRHMHASFIVR